jgi:hypothetical protein
MVLVEAQNLAPPQIDIAPERRRIQLEWVIPKSSATTEGSCEAKLGTLAIKLINIEKGENKLQEGVPPGPFSPWRLGIRR